MQHMQNIMWANMKCPKLELLYIQHEIETKYRKCWYKLQEFMSEINYASDDKK